MVIKFIDIEGIIRNTEKKLQLIKLLDEFTEEMLLRYPGISTDWGAMHPTEERTVLKIEGDRMWCEEGFTMLLADLRDMNENYRSPIGVYRL